MRYASTPAATEAIRPTTTIAHSSFEAARMCVERRRCPGIKKGSLFRLPMEKAKEPVVSAFRRTLERLTSRHHHRGVRDSCDNERSNYDGANGAKQGNQREQKDRR